MGLRLIFLMICVGLPGCSAFPDVVHEPQFHNPFPQLHRVAVLPFYNQSADPTVDQEKIAIAYYNELQAIPGFEVVPVGVTRRFLEATGIVPRPGADFQRLAAMMGVDAVVMGSVTEYSPYYPPRMGLVVRWYAANPCFYPVPPGYGLPWGTAEEEYIPEELVFEAEFALAQEQLATQTPQPIPPGFPPSTSSTAGPVRQVGHAEEPEGIGPGEAAADPESGALGAAEELPPVPPDPLLPADWPDPRGFVPAAPSPQRPECIPQSEPVLSLARIYHGNDADFTRRLADYTYFRDDARRGDWQAYLQRSDDFIRFCCHLHISEMLAARGGAGKTRVVWRWPIGRYER